MPALQREIVDDRRYRFGDVPPHTGVNSFGIFGLRAGLAASDASSAFGDVLVRSDKWLSRPELYVGAFPVEPRMAETVTVRHATRSPASGLRERELEWRRTHAATLRQYENEWVVLEGEEIVAHGSNPTQVLQEAKAKGIRTPYIFFVEQKKENVITIGL